VLEIAPLEDYAAVDEALASLQRYAWLVITSANGVDAMFARLETMGRDARALSGVKIAAVGPATAQQLAARGIRADLVPGEAVGEALADALIQQDVAGRRILLLRAEVARKSLTAALVAAGAVCDDLAVYRTACPPSLPAEFVERWDRGQVEWITLTSPSSLNNLLTLLGPERAASLYNVKLASIGPVTTQAIRDRGLIEAVEAEPHDVRGLVEAMRKFETRNGVGD
jgi:uroporphyrinogen III methyltransferase / synthase